MIRGWHGLLATFTGVALITVAVLPLAALAVWALARLWCSARGPTMTSRLSLAMRPRMLAQTACKISQSL